MIDPQKRQELMVRVVRRMAKRLEQTIRRAFDEGWGLWQIAKPQQRLQGYERCTFPEDRPLVLDPDYLSKWRIGISSPLRALTTWQQMTQAQADMNGQPQTPPPIQDYGPLFWALLLNLPDFVFEHFASDFRSLLGQQERKTPAHV